MTSGDAKRSVTARPRGTAMQRGTNMNCVAMIRAVTLPSGPTVVPRLCSANSPDRCNVLGSIRSTLLGGLISLRQSREHDHAERGGNEHADTKRPQQFGAENSPLVNFGWSVGHAVLAHRSARQEDQQIDRQIAKHQQRYGRSGEDGGAQRRHAHDLGERSFINLISDLSRTISVRRLVEGSSVRPRRVPA